MDESWMRECQIKHPEASDPPETWARWRLSMAWHLYTKAGGPWARKWLRNMDSGAAISGYTLSPEMQESRDHLLLLLAMKGDDV